MNTEQTPDGEEVIEDALMDIKKRAHDIEEKELEILEDEEKIIQDEIKIVGEARKEEHEEFHIQIDRDHYTVTQRSMTGSELRRVPLKTIGPDYDLFEVISGGSDQKIGDSQVVGIRSGLRFFTVPAHINPGMAIWT